ncbi:hypothetical protein LTR17_003345 [Elasticomyces elasticus]|nr:hypothetical protein LTR17_003345 [Elasticomyces elasticus]
MPAPAVSLAFLLNNRGAIYEADIFAAIQQSPHIVRAFEFALCDAAIACDSHFPLDLAYADRFAQVERDASFPVPERPCRLIFFDVKGKRSNEHKLDGNPHRLAKNRLDKVGIARGSDTKRGYYFTHVDRLDFLFYQFQFSDGTETFFFIPECELPDYLYTTLDKEADFSEFRSHFYFSMTEDPQWIRSVLDIVRRYPQPRREGHRPIRQLSSSLQTKPDGLSLDSEDTAGPSIDRNTLAHGRHTYSTVLNKCQQQFYKQIMQQFARDKYGVLIVLAHKHQVGDLGYCSYVWTAEERHRYLIDETPPVTIDYLSGYTSVVPFCYFTRALEISHAGPAIRTAPFRRLDGFEGQRLLIYNL